MANATIDQWRDMLKGEALSYDLKESRKRGYNPNAYFHYVAQINDALEMPEFLENPRKCLAEHFIIRGETGGIYHRNLPADCSDVKFTLSFVNSAVKKMKA